MLKQLRSITQLSLKSPQCQTFVNEMWIYGICRCVYCYAIFIVVQQSRQMIDGIVGYNLQGGHYTSQLRIHTSLEVPMNAEIEASDIVSFNYFHKWERVSIIVKYTSHLNPQFQVKICGAKLSFVQTFILRTCIC